MSKIFKNYIYQTCFQVLSILLPFIVIPYVTNILGPELYGKYTYEVTLSTYFYTFLNFGLNLYGTREMSYYRNCRQTVSILFFKIVFLKIFLFLISLIIYPFVHNSVLWYLTIFNIAFLFFDFTWCLQALQYFKAIFFRSLFLKVTTFSLIFLFVKNQDDFLIYASILLIGNFISVLFLIPIIARYINLSLYKYTFSKNIFKVLLLSLPLFIQQLFIDLYNSIDKYFINYFVGNSDVGFYEIVQKIVRMMLFFISSVAIVITPELSFRIKNKMNYNELLTMSFKFILYLSIIASCFLSVFAELIISVLLDPRYISCILLLQIYSFILIPIAMGSIIGSQYMISMGMEKVYKYPILIGLIANVILNIFLINKFGAQGAVITALVSENLVVFSMILFVYKSYNFLDLIKKEYRLGIYLLFSILFSMFLNSIDYKSTLYLCMSLLFVLSSLFLLLYKNPFVFNVIAKLKKRTV